MIKGFGQADPALAGWAEETFRPEDAALAEIRARSDRCGMPPIHVGAFDGRHLEVLTRAIAAQKVVEIGTLAGYSGLCLLRGMSAAGILHTFEADSRHAEVARDTFQKNGVLDRVQIHVGPALERLHEIEADGPFDLIFIDADKESYPLYLSWAEHHLRLGGVVLADNAFAFGGLARPASSDDPATAALRLFNQRLAQSGRFHATMLPTEEGLAMGVRVR